MRLAIFKWMSKGCSIVGGQILNHFIEREQYLRMYYENIIINNSKNSKYTNSKTYNNHIILEELGIIHNFLAKINSRVIKGISMFDRSIIHLFLQPYQKEAVRNAFFNSTIWKQ